MGCAILPMAFPSHSHPRDLPYQAEDPNLLIPYGPTLALDKNAAAFGAKAKLQEAVAW